MGNFYRVSLAILIAGPALLASSRSSHAQSKNPIYESDPYYGLTEEEISALDGKSKVFAEKYKAGRADSSNKEKFKKGSTRHFDTIFMHDANGDGITDHSSKVLGASSLESGSNKAADNIVEKTPKDSTAAKDPDHIVEANLQEWREEAEKPCRKKYGDLKSKNPDKYKDLDIEAICYQPSPNLKNVGAVHGPDTDEHRAYQLTDAAKKAAEAAGKEYANRAWGEAANYEGSNDVRRIPGKPGRVMVKAVRNGKEVWEEKNVAANPDLIQSEVAWIEQEKENNLRQNFKVLRARNLASREFTDDHEFDSFVANSYKSTNPNEIKKADRAVAIMIAEKRGAANTKFCWKDDQAQIPEREESSAEPCAQNEFSRTVSDQMNFVRAKLRINDLSPQDKIRMREAALSKQSNESRKATEAEIEKIRNCLGEDKWCSSRAGQIPKKEAFEEFKSGDPGGLYRDTRETLYKKSLLGVKGSLSDYEKAMEADVDSRNHPDYKKFKKEMAEAKAEYQRFLQEERAREAYSRANGGNYKSPYLNQKNFNPAKMNSRQLSGRNVRRGDATFSNGYYYGKTLPSARPVQSGTVGGVSDQAMRKPGSAQPPRNPRAPLVNPR